MKAAIDFQYLWGKGSISQFTVRITLKGCGCTFCFPEIRLNIFLPLTVVSEGSRLDFYPLP